MEWMCTYLMKKLEVSEYDDVGPFDSGLNSTFNQSEEINVNVSLDMNITDNATSGSSTYPPDYYYTYRFEFVSMRILLPAICVFGIIGNILNIFILVKRVLEGTDNLEKGATIGLIALAISDLTFCICTLIASFVPNDVLIFRSHNLSYVVAMYWNYAQNVLIKTSTWFTVVLAVGRYYAVCFPMKARQYMRCGHTVRAIILSAVFWMCFKLPLLWTFGTKEIDCTHVSERIGKVYMLTVGEYQKHPVFVTTMNYTWAVTGFFVPVGILGYCNYKLVQSLRASRKFRCLPDSGRSKPAASDPQRRISITLVSIVVMFFLLVCPSEITHFYATVKKPTDKVIYRSALILTNLLQGVNFSINFVLYCAVNAYFRRVIRQIFSCSNRGTRSGRSFSEMHLLRSRSASTTSRASSRTSRISTVFEKK